MEKTNLAPDADPSTGKPPASSPLETAWEAFDRMALPRRMSGEQRRYLKHAFYAGARSCFAGVIDAMKEAAEGVADGELRFEQLEREISEYWASINAHAMVARTGRT